MLGRRQNFGLFPVGPVNLIKHMLAERMAGFDIWMHEVATGICHTNTLHHRLRRQVDDRCKPKHLI